MDRKAKKRGKLGGVLASICAVALSDRRMFLISSASTKLVTYLFSHLANADVRLAHVGEREQ